MTILVGYIPTPQGEAALAAAIGEARAHEESVLVINMSRDDKLVDAHRAESSDLDRLDRDLAESGVAHEVRRIEHGTDPADQILEVIEREYPRMLVIGIRHRSPVGKLLMGSTAQRLLLGAACPVLAVKAD
ncbi:universal stress protein [Terrabacter lapilli]|uniref:Universal stress protein n=1 Tax=Terrabacter lapilli TaxID=436231 RepID=A0ABN2SSL6_9MICO